MKSGQQSGFSTLETLVAIAILAISLTPLLAYQAQLASSAERLRRQSDLQSARRVAENYLMELSAADLPEGSIDLGGGWTLTWTTLNTGEPVLPPLGGGISTRYSGDLTVLEASLVDSQGFVRSMPTRRLIIQETGPVVAE